MEYLAPFNPHLIGAVLNRTATEHSDLHLHLFTDSAKDVEIMLLNDSVPFEVDEAREPADALETIRLLVPRRLLQGQVAVLGAVLIVLPTDGVRIASRFRSDDPMLSAIESSGRASLRGVCGRCWPTPPALAHETARHSGPARDRRRRGRAWGRRGLVAHCTEYRGDRSHRPVLFVVL